MAAFTCFHRLSRDLLKGVHVMNDATPPAHILNIYLAGTAANPAAAETNPVYASVAEFNTTYTTTANGYAQYGKACINQSTPTAVDGTTAGLWHVNALAATTVSWTNPTAGSPGVWASFAEVVLMNNTQTTPAKPLLGFWPNSTVSSLAEGASFKVKFLTGYVINVDSSNT